MTIQELIAKYSKIFQPYEGNPGGSNWTGLPKGWIKVVDKLCGSIQDYIDTVTIFVDNPDYVEGSEWDRDDKTTHKKIGSKIPQVTCVQMKEKFGGLRFYTNGHDDVIEGMIQMAQYICDNTCEVCGSEENLGNTHGWVTVCCKSCYEAGKASGKGWEPKK